MRIYDNETKIYPDLEPTAQEELQSYRLHKLCEIETYFFDAFDRISKKMKRFNIITGAVDTILIISKIITGGISIAAFASGVVLHVSIALRGASLFLYLPTAIARKSFKNFTVKQEKHDSIKLLEQSKLDSIANIILQTMQDGNISPTEFHNVLQKVENTCSFINHRITIHHNIFLKSLLCRFSHCIFHQSLIIYFLINDLLLLKFIQTRHIVGNIRTKNNLLALCDGIFEDFFNLFVCFHAGLTGYIQLFLPVLTVTSCSFINSFVTPSILLKSFWSSFYISKNPSSSLIMLHCWLSASLCLHSSTYT